MIAYKGHTQEQIDRMVFTNNQRLSGPAITAASVFSPFVTH